MHIWREGLGLILRGFSLDPAKVPERAEKLIKAAAHAAALLADGELVYRQIVIAVPINPRYPDHDCGELVAALRTFGLPDRTVVLSIDGDYICGALNQSVRKLYHGGCKYAHIVSTSAFDFVNEIELQQANQAFSAGAKAFGLAFDELAPLVLGGFVQNTWAIWNILDLLAYGGFDLRAAQQPDVQDRYGAGGGPSSGVEEVLPLCLLIKYHGPCIAVASALTTGAWCVPDAELDSARAARHREKMASKWSRITERAQQAGYTPDFVTAGVMHN